MLASFEIGRRAASRPPHRSSYVSGNSPRHQKRRTWIREYPKEMAVKMVSVGIDPLNRRLTLSVLTLRAKPEGDTEIILGDNLRDSAGDHRVFSRKVAKSVADCTEVPAEYIHELARIRLDHLARRDEHTMNDGVAHSQREAIACAHK